MPGFSSTLTSVFAFDFVLGFRSGVQFADFLYLLPKLIPVLNVGMFPVRDFDEA
jgi:hypothetical protein